MMLDQTSTDALRESATSHTISLHLCSGVGTPSGGPSSTSLATFADYLSAPPYSSKVPTILAAEKKALSLREEARLLEIERGMAEPDLHLDDLQKAKEVCDDVAGPEAFPDKIGRSIARRERIETDREDVVELVYGETGFLGLGMCLQKVRKVMGEWKIHIHQHQHHIFVRR